MFRQTRGQEANDRGGHLVRRGPIHPAVPMENFLAVGEALKPELRDPAVIQLPGGLMGMLGKHQRLVAVAGDFAFHPRSGVRSLAVFLMITRSSPRSRSACSCFAFVIVWPFEAVDCISSMTDSYLTSAETASELRERF